MPTPDQILNAAERIHSKHGLAELSLRRVARSVRVTPMAIYKHFDDKTALLDGLAARGFAILETYLDQAMQKRGALSRLRAALVQFREFALAHPRYFELMYFARRSRVPTAPASLRETSSPSFAKVIAALHECIERGEIRRGDAGETILLVWATAHGLIALHFSGRFGDDVQMFRAVYDRAIAEQLRLLSGG